MSITVGRREELSRALVDAVLQRDVVAVERLLADGADADTVTGRSRANSVHDSPGERWPLVVLAARDGEHNIVRLLVDAGADVARRHESERYRPMPADDHRWEDGDDALTTAAGAGHFDVVELLLQRPASSSREDALSAAVRSGRRAIVKLLLDHGVDPGSKARLTALGVAVIEGHLDVVRLLVEYGALPAATGHAGDVFARPGWTPLVDAIRRGHTEIAQFLVAQGAPLPPPAELTDIVRYVQAPAAVADTLRALGLPVPSSLAPAPQPQPSHSPSQSPERKARKRKPR